MPFIHVNKAENVQNVPNKEKFQQKYLATTDGFSKQKSEGALLVKLIALTGAQY